LLGKDTKGF